MTAKISAVVVSFNNQNEIEKCLASLVDSGIDEIIVVDNNSSDNTTELVGKFAGVQLVSNRSNVGFGAAVNQIALSKSGLVLAVNADTFVNADAVAALQAAAKSDTSVALIGPTIRDETGDIYPSPRRFPGVVDAVGHAIFANIWKSNPFSKRYKMSDRRAKGTSDVDWVSGACMLINTKLFQNIGGFDEDYFMYMEDVDLCKRIHLAGWRVLYVPDAEVIHIQGASTSQKPTRSIWYHHRSLLRYTTVHMRGADRFLLPFIWMGILVRAALKMAMSLAHSSSGTD